ncbi:MAG TPA: NUDIX hydrolase [Pseudonocardiaceae bacterium]|nr:NUDIX hydrolase [Pseudonocardiaceae bacterium]
MTEQRPHSVSVAGIVVNDEGKVLVIRRRDNNRWEPPGGILEAGETFEQGVRREVHEETGFWVNVDRLTGVYKNMSRLIVALVFQCTLEAGSISTSDESREVCWMTIDQVKQAMTPAYAIRVIDGIQRHGVRTRAHDGVDLRDGYSSGR